METTVAINVHGNLPGSRRPVVGNGLRANQLGQSLAAHGYHPVYLAHRSFYQGVEPETDVNLFTTAEEFNATLDRLAPRLLVCIQGEGLDLLPGDGVGIPVMADWIAPRMLEFAFQGLPLEQWLMRLVNQLRKADYHSCCTDRQRAYLYAFLQLAGVELDHARLPVIPLSCSTGFADKPAASPEPVFVSGGIHWPWIHSGRFLKIAVEEMEQAGKGRLKLFGGTYPFSTDSSRYTRPDEGLPSSERIEIMGLIPYPELMEHYLAADVAIDLFEENAERQLALSFREIDYLQSGLPIICPSFSTIAPYILSHQAGWVVEDLSSEEVRKIFRRILTGAEDPRMHSKGARAVIRHHFDQAKTIRPLLAILENPQRHSTAPSLLQSALSWGDFARIELDKTLIELRSARLQINELNGHVEGYRTLSTEKDRQLSASAGIIEEIRRYTTEKEKDLTRCVELLGKKDRTLGEQDAIITALRQEKDWLAEERSRLLSVAEEKYRLEEEKRVLEESLARIRSTLAYRVYRKLFGR